MDVNVICIEKGGTIIFLAGGCNHFGAYLKSMCNVAVRWGVVGGGGGTCKDKVQCKV